MASDRDRPVRDLSPMAIADIRARRFADPADRSHFMQTFSQARVAEVRGDARAYLWFRAALDADDSVAVAGLIEGAASAHSKKGLVF